MNGDDDLWLGGFHKKKEVGFLITIEKFSVLFCILTLTVT